MKTTTTRQGRQGGGWRVGLGVALAIAAAGCGGEKVAPGKVAHAPGLALPAGAATHTVVVAPLAPRVDVVGTVTSAEKIHLSARLSAYVNDVTVSAGSRVTKDQLLLTLDDRELREQLAAAEAQMKQAESEFQRAKQLLETKATTDQAFTAAETARNGARAQVERVNVMLTYAQIRAPIAGIVTDRRIEKGDLANPGQVLLVVYDPTRMRLEAAVPLRLVDKLALNQSVEVKLDRPARAFKGRVAQIVSEADPLTRTQTVKVDLEGETGDVLPGSFGRLYVDEEPRPTILVPASAVYAMGQLEIAQVVQDGRVLRRLVRTGLRVGDQVEILSGLRAGDTLLVTPVKEG